MKYKIVTADKTRVVSLSEISTNLGVSSEVYELSDREIYLGVISHKTLVFFAVEFTNYALQNYTKKIIPEAQTCIDLTRKWLEDQSSVSKEELRAAYYAAAAYAACPAYAAAAAAYAAHTAYAADAAAYAAGVGRNKECLRQGEFIIDFLKSGRNLFVM